MMSKLSLTTVLFVFLPFIFSGIQGQTAQTQLNQVELMKQLQGTWQEAGKDTVEVWEIQPYGKAIIQNVFLVINGKKTPIYKCDINFDSQLGKLKGYILNYGGNSATWLGAFTSEKKLILNQTENFNPEKLGRRMDLEFETPTRIIWTLYHKEGVEPHVIKYDKVK